MSKELAYSLVMAGVDLMIDNHEILDELWPDVTEARLVTNKANSFILNGKQYTITLTEE